MSLRFGGLMIAEQQETARLIDRAMKRMPEKFREVVMLKI